AGVDEDGQGAEIDARPVEDFGPLRPAEVLPALRAGRLRGVSEAVAAGRQPRPDAQGAGAGAGPGDFGPARAGRVRGRPPAARGARRGVDQAVTARPWQ